MNALGHGFLHSKRGLGAPSESEVLPNISDLGLHAAPRPGPVRRVLGRPKSSLG